MLKPYHLEVKSRGRTLLRAVGLGALAVGLLLYGFYYALTTPWLLVPFLLPLGCMLLLVVWMLPAMRTAPTVAMERLYFALFIVMFLWPNYLAFALSGLPWVTLIRLTGFPMVLALLISISVSKSFRAELYEVTQGAPWISRAVITFAAIMVLSLALSKTPMTSVQKLIVGAVNWIAIYFVTAYVLAKPGRIMRWAFVLWVSVAVISLVGVYEAFTFKIPWAGHTPPFLKVDPLVSSILSGSFRSATGEYRTKATFTTALGLAEFLALSMPFLLHLAMGPFKRYVRVAAVLTLPVAFFVIEATGSRLGMVGSGLSILLYTLIWSFQRWRAKKMGLLGPTMLMAYPAVASLVLVASFTVNAVRRRVWGGGATAASDAGRQYQLDVGIPKIISNPFGNGIGRAAETLGIRGSGDKLTIDNYYLAIGLEYGVIGFIVFYGMILLAIIYGLRASLRPSSDPELSFVAPCAVSLVSFFVVKWVFAQQDNHPIVFMIMGAICAMVWRIRREEMTRAESVTQTR